jgi:hypothetical protein
MLVGLTLCLVSTGCDEDEAALPFAGYAWAPAQAGFGSGSLLLIPTAAASTTGAGGGGR